MLQLPELTNGVTVCMQYYNKLACPRVKNNCWPVAVFLVKLTNGQAFLKVVGRLGQPKTHVTVDLQNIHGTSVIIFMQDLD